MIKILILTLLLCYMPIAACTASQRDKEELTCLSKVIFHEARGESLQGQIAVGFVVKNRVESKLFPNTICEVVHQRKQFTDFSKRKNYDNHDSELWDKSMNSAVLVFLGKRTDNTKGALFYLNPYKVSKKVLTKWTKHYRLHKTIGNHQFYGVKI